MSEPDVGTSSSSDPGVELPQGTKRSRWITVLATLNVLNILASLFGSSIAAVLGIDSWVAWAIFPVIPGLAMVPAIWFMVFGVAAAISGVVSLAGKERRGYRFFASMTVCGFFVLIIVPAFLIFIGFLDAGQRL